MLFRSIVFTGLAGGVGTDVRVGDIVVADRTVQHDMDARPLFPRHEVPLLDQAEFPADPVLTAALRGAAEDFLRDDLATEVPAGVLARFGVDQPRLHVGMIASGDQFINAPQAVADVRYLDEGAIRADCERLRSALPASGYEEAFMTAPSPGIVSTTMLNAHYESQDRKSTRLNSSHSQQSRMPSSA